MLVNNALSLLKCIHADIVAAWIDAYVNDISCKDYESNMDKAHRYKWLVSKDCVLPDCEIQDINRFIENYEYKRTNADCLGSTVTDSSCILTLTDEETVSCNDIIYISNYPLI